MLIFATAVLFFVLLYADTVIILAFHIVLRIIHNESFELESFGAHRVLHYPF